MTQGYQTYHFAVLYLLLPQNLYTSLLPHDQVNQKYL